VGKIHLVIEKRRLMEGRKKECTFGCTLFVYKDFLKKISNKILYYSGGNFVEGTIRIAMGTSKN